MSQTKGRGWACLMLFSNVAGAQAVEREPDIAQAEVVLLRYLRAVQARKWPEAKKYIHPDTLKVIAERKRRLGEEDHPLAPWYQEKGAYVMKAFVVVSAQAAILGTVLVETQEDNFQIVEKGMAEAEMASYLMGRKQGRWYVVDKKRGERFSSDSIRWGYRKYLDAPDPSPDEED